MEVTIAILASTFMGIVVGLAGSIGALRRRMVDEQQREQLPAVFKLLYRPVKFESRWQHEINALTYVLIVVGSVEGFIWLNDGNKVSQHLFFVLPFIGASFLTLLSLEYWLTSKWNPIDSGE